mmetsp:Transcript_6177/g.17089  ORF Transcript_6177/g.17089 Transcript_6177/m.17089 type:complete len:508 (+) Transcript_6177:64-1587(+)|eukprot:CAMPEP_0115197010 /NCGR_PEP_ID=MMETSP0270-20121206/15379_1 /TAXON_ID=71861 /ORGANISM="Scrippsiella trochoidea, Strain CCMP3099" /LENGTH=507 /DNA_ID=CAMNT_0002610357 /DNA_START=24 /DNA_END=1547 /DNA_ORIENTATION=-
MLSRLRSFSNPALLSGISEVEEDEHGSWHYLIVDTRGVRPRTGATYNKEAKTQQPRIKEGTVIDVSRRRRAGLTRFLCMSTGEGWIHDVSPKDHGVRAVEVEVLIGKWQYQVSTGRVAVLPKPSLHLTEVPPKNAGNLHAGDSITVVQRIRPLSGKGSFLALSECRGFVFDMVRGVQVLHRSNASNQRGLGEEPISSPTRQGGGGDNGFVAAASPASHDSVPLDVGDQQPLSLLRSSSTSLELGPSEYGNWQYVVLDPAGIRLRGSPAYDKGQKLSSRLPAGELVDVVERRTCTDGTSFLRLESPAGWAFDVQPGACHKRHRMSEVSIEHGKWFYRVSASKGMAFRARCSFADDAKLGKGPDLGTLLTIRQRVRVGGTVFLKVDGQNGWLFDCKDGRQLAEGPVDMITHQDAFTTVLAPEGLHLLSSPTRQKWAQTNKCLLIGARVQVMRTCQVEDAAWSYVAQPGGGMEGWSLASNLKQLVDEQFGSVAAKAHDVELLRKTLNFST